MMGTIMFKISKRFEDATNPSTRPLKRLPVPFVTIFMQLMFEHTPERTWLS